MNSRERVLGAFNRTGFDRIPVKHEGTPEINQMIMNPFGLTSLADAVDESILSLKAGKDTGEINLSKLF